MTTAVALKRPASRPRRNLPSFAGGGGGGTLNTSSPSGNVTVNNNVVTWVSTGTSSANALHIPVSSTTMSTNGSIITITGGTATTINNAMHQQMLAQLNQSQIALMSRNGRVKLDSECEIELPNGTIIDMKADGSYQIIDQDAKIKYKGNPLREFNRYINASDLLEEFVDFVASVGGINKDGFLNLPIELFIRWLIIRAAEADGDDAPEDEKALKAHPALLPAPAVMAISYRNCKCCGRFVTRKKADHGMLFCSAEHFERFEAKIA